MQLLLLHPRSLGASLIEATTSFFRTGRIGFRLARGSIGGGGL